MSFLSDASLVMIPSGYKDGTLYSAKPTNGDGDFTFSRGSNLAATRVNSDGLIEKGRENLLLQSNQFDTTWSLSNASVTSGQSGYDGSSDAWLLSKTGDYGRVEQNTSASGIYTLSVYAKSGTLDWLSFENSGISADTCFFDLSNGVVGSKGAGVVSTSIESIGNGWYRCSAVFNGAFGISRIQPSISDGVVNGTNGNILIQDAQLELGLVSTPYIDTGASTAQAGILEDMPRLDYSGGASCPSLLLEPQRSNVVTSSEHLGSYSVSNVSVSYNNATSPEGVQNATLVTGNSGTSTKVVNFNPASNGAYTISVFAKYNTHQWIQLGMGGVATYANFDIQNGVVGGTNGTSDIEDYGNGWYRCSVQMTTGTPISHYIGMVDSSSSVRLATSSSTNSFWAYGMQSEIGSYPTSYIPTYGSSVTRSADSCSKTGISSLIGQSEGTVFIDFDFDYSDSNTQVLFKANQSTDANSVGIEVQSTTIKGLVNSGGGNIATITGTIATGRIKAALAYKTNDMAFYVNGTQVGVDTLGSIAFAGVVDIITIGQFLLNGSSFFPASRPFNEALVFPTRLTNDELTSLTTI